jgi:hypothetical protein
MGASSVALDAARSALMRGTLEKGTAAGQWWADALAARLPASATGGGGAKPDFTRVALRQMSGKGEAPCSHCLATGYALQADEYALARVPDSWAWHYRVSKFVVRRVLLCAVQRQCLVSAGCSCCPVSGALAFAHVHSSLLPVVRCPRYCSRALEPAAHLQVSSSSCTCAPACCRTWARSRRITWRAASWV